ncbi:Uncharacterised protein [Mycobacterium tuberculosis]|nr:Uncharacterised protein [Mycobacterium tuberculosis]
MLFFDQNFRRNAGNLQSPENDRNITYYIAAPIGGQNKAAEVIAIIQRFKKFLILFIFPLEQIVPLFEFILVLGHPVHKLLRGQSFAKLAA